MVLNRTPPKPPSQIRTFGYFHPYPYGLHSTAFWTKAPPGRKNNFQKEQPSYWSLHCIPFLEQQILKNCLLFLSSDLSLLGLKGFRFEKGKILWAEGKKSAKPVPTHPTEIRTHPQNTKFLWLPLFDFILTCRQSGSWNFFGLFSKV